MRIATFSRSLAAALIRRGGQRDVFDKTFDLYFPLATGATQVVREHDEVTIEDLRDLLAMALAENDLRTLEQVAELAVDALGRVGNGIEGGTGQNGFSAYQTGRMSADDPVAAWRRGSGKGST